MGEHARREGLGLGPHAVAPVTARVQVDAVAPGGEVDVAAVADALPEDRRGEGHREAVALRHRPDRLPHQHAAVGRRHRVERGHRELELPGRVLGMELVDLHALPRERRQQIGGTVAQLDLAGGTVRRARDRGHELALGARRLSNGPLDLDARLEGRAVPLRGFPDRPAQEGAAARGMPLALLRDPVDRRPRPAGLSGQFHQLVEVGVEAQIAVRGAEDVGGDDGVVREERVEHR